MILGSLWLIPALCLAGALVNLALGAARAPKSMVTVVGVGSVGAATAAGYAALWEYLNQPIGVVIEPYFTSQPGASPSMRRFSWTPFRR